MCAYERGQVCVHGERKDEGVKCVCTGRGRICVYGRVYCVFMGRRRMCVYGRDGLCMERGRMKGSSVRAWGGYVYMEGVECVCMGRGRICVYGRGGVCVHREREDMCVWKGLLCVHGERENVCIRKGWCVHGR